MELKYKILLIMVIIMTIVFLASCKGTDSDTVVVSESRKSPLQPFTRVTLENGLDVIVKEVHTAPIVAVYLWCKTGSANETVRMEASYDGGNFFSDC